VSPITHFLASWTASDLGGFRKRDLALAAWCGVLPDLDGFGVVLDGANHLLGRPDSWYYGQFHHVLLHGLPGAILIAFVMCLFAADRMRVFACGFVMVHLHLFCDLIGARGPGVDDIWPISYLAPFSDRWTLSWSGQWALNAWPNILLTIGLIVYAFVRAAWSRYSPVGAFSGRADRVFVDAVGDRWRRIRGIVRT
jgi:LexA-binding, inner membrane-associated putative hydrolase